MMTTALCLLEDGAVLHVNRHEACGSGFRVESDAVNCGHCSSIHTGAQHTLPMLAPGQTPGPPHRPAARYVEVDLSCDTNHRI